MKDYETLPPIVIERGQGIHLYDVDGKRYLDVVSSWWCNLLGHSHPKINQAIKNQLDSLEHVIFANFSHKPAITLCEELMKNPAGTLQVQFFRQRFGVHRIRHENEFPVPLPDRKPPESALHVPE